MSARKRDIAQINRNGAVDPDSNYASARAEPEHSPTANFFTRSKKRGDYNKALQTLVFHGATPEIFTNPIPISERINCRGDLQYPADDSRSRRIVRFRCAGYRCRIARRSREKGWWVGDTLYEGAAVVLATGHSARDIYELLHRRGVRLEAKPFAMGVRIEHPQALIDSIQYHCESRGEYLPAASYSLVSQEGGRGVYSFCMCPGGFIVPAMTDAAESVVNGMSPERPELRFRQFRFGDRGAACGFRASAGRGGRAGRAEIPAAVRAAGPAIRRRASDRSGPACRRFRGGTCERFAAPDLVYTGRCAFPAG